MTNGTDSQGDTLTVLDFRQVLDALADPVVAADGAGHIVYVNRAVEDLLGWTAAELVGQTVGVLQPERLREAAVNAFLRFAQGPEMVGIGPPVRMPVVRRDGSEVEVELSASLMRAGDGGTVAIVSLRDLRERVELEHERSIARRLRATAEAAGRITSRLDFDYVLQTVATTLTDEFGAALARVWLVAPGTNTLYLRLQAGSAAPPGYSPTEHLHWQALPIWIDQVLKDRTPFVQNAIAEDPRFDREWAEREGIVSVAAFPLLTAGEARGVLIYHSRRTINDELVEILTTFASIVATSLNDVQHFVREQEARAEAEQAQGTFAFLAEASRVLASSLDYETPLANLANLAVPYLADVCIVDVLEGNNAIRRLAIATADSDQANVARRLKRYAPSPDSRSPVARVLRMLEPEIGRNLTVEELADLVQDYTHLDVLQTLGVRSFMCVPMVAHGRVRGAITFVGTSSGREYSESDLALGKDVALRAAIAIDNASLYREVEEAVQLRDDFLSSVSHDLKNPIAAIKGRAQMLRRRSRFLPEAEAARFEDGLDAIDTTTDRMVRLISGLVDVARLRIGQPLELHRQITDLFELTQDVVNEQRETGASHSILLESDGGAVTGRWDRDRLERVLVNLISNAVKYSPAGSEIRVCVSREGDEAVVRVSDRGMGIPAEDVPHVFDRFFRASNVGDTIPGTGIGLAGARQIAEQHGGTIEVESREGEGSTFTLCIPIGTTDPAVPLS